MAYGNRYYLDFYDRFNNKFIVNIQQEDYVGSREDVTGGETPVKIHWLGEGDEKYKPIKGSECEIQLVSDTNHKFLSIFENTARKYRVLINNVNSPVGTATLWRGFLDQDSYSEPYTTTPYTSVLHASDGLGELKGIRFPEPSGATYGVLQWSLIYIIAEILKQTGHELNIYVASDITWSSNTLYDDTYLWNKVLRDENGEYDYCYDILEKILLSTGARIYQWFDRWYIERIDYVRDGTADYRVYDSDGVYDSTSSSQNTQLYMTDKHGDYDADQDGTPETAGNLCVWVGQTPELEIQPAVKTLTIEKKPGELKSILKSTNHHGLFIDTEFTKPPPPQAGVLVPRFWTWVDNYNGYNAYIHGYSKFPGTDNIRIKGIVLPEVDLPGSPPFTGSGPADNPYLISDSVGLDWKSTSVNGSLKLKLNMKVGGYSDDRLFPYWRPFFGFTIKVRCENAGWTYLDEDRSQCFISSSAGNTTTLYAFEVDNKLYWASSSNAQEYFKQNSSDEVPNIPGVQNCAFKDGNTELKEYNLEFEPIYFEPDYQDDVYVQMIIYPMHARWWVVPPVWMKPDNDSYNFVDVYNVGLQIVDGQFDYEETADVVLNEDNRENKTLTYYLDDGTSHTNQRYFNKYVPLSNLGAVVGPNWESGGVAKGGLINGCLLPEITSQYQIPRRKLTGKLLSDPDDMDFGKVLLDNSLIRYICTGVEFDLKNAYWEGEWLEVHDPNNMRLGDYDADDFDDTDFWAI